MVWSTNITPWYLAYACYYRGIKKIVFEMGRSIVSYMAFFHPSLRERIVNGLDKIKIVYN
jgi:hypothetical protein